MNWRELTARLGSLREDELEQMIEDELAGPKCLERPAVGRAVLRRRRILLRSISVSDPNERHRNQFAFYGAPWTCLIQ